jgi:hypothetical protein
MCNQAVRSIPTETSPAHLRVREPTTTIRSKDPSVTDALKPDT